MPPGRKWGLKDDVESQMMDSFTVRDVLEELDAALAPRNILRLCPNYADAFEGFACPSEVWYPQELLELLSNLVFQRLNQAAT